ncbi:MAG: sugar transferase [Acidobacteria bacterium]|nr:sugar transferase [Acidobacteriota bacterium]
MPQRFIDEDLFSTLLTLERKRSERTGETFALALLEVSAIRKKSSVKVLCTALCGETRDTDIIGWYDHPLKIGIIFNTLNGVPLDAVRVRLKEKIDSALSCALKPVDRAKVVVTLHFFPVYVDEKLYPELTNGKSRPVHRALKRTVDILGSLVMLLTHLPLFIAIPILIKLTSSGPVFFRQRRLGMFGREFDFLKFRTMYSDNDPEVHRKYIEELILHQARSGTAYKLQNDPRVTPLGRYLRKLSLDELPQFFNVLKGDMSLVGPRPPIPYELENYRFWHKRRVIEVKPGITGLWQVYGRSRTTFDDMVRLDLRYVRHQSVLLDLKILALTPRAVLLGSGAY